MFQSCRIALAEMNFRYGLLGTMFRGRNSFGDAIIFVLNASEATSGGLSWGCPSSIAALIGTLLQMEALGLSRKSSMNGTVGARILPSDIALVFPSTKLVIASLCSGSSLSSSLSYISLRVELLNTKRIRRVNSSWSTVISSLCQSSMSLLRP